MPAAASPTRPEVSVIVPVHNREAYLRLAIDSVLNQTLQNFELIIVNDGSSNAECLQIIQDYESQDGRVRVVHQEQSGAPAARNAGIAEARGAYITFLDDDDICEPLCLEKQAAFLHERKYIAAVTALCIHIDERGRATKYGYPESTLPREPVIYKPDLDIYKNAFSTDLPRPPTLSRLVSKIDSGIYKHLFQTRLWVVTRSMWRAHILKTLKWNPLFLSNQDCELSLRLMERYPTAVIPEYLYRYRVYKKSTHSLSSIPLAIHYRMTSFLCAHYRRRGQPEPLQELTNVRELVPLFKELPFPAVANCLSGLRHMLKKMLVCRKDEWLFILLADMDKAFLNSEHAAYYALVRKQALHKLRIAALKRGKFLWLLKNSQRLASP